MPSWGCPQSEIAALNIEFYMTEIQEILLLNLIALYIVA